MDYSVTQEILRHVREFSQDNRDRAYWKYTGNTAADILGSFLRRPRCAHRGWAGDLLEKRDWITQTGINA